MSQELSPALDRACAAAAKPVELAHCGSIRLTETSRGSCHRDPNHLPADWTWVSWVQATGRQQMKMFNKTWNTTTVFNLALTPMTHSRNWHHNTALTPARQAGIRLTYHGGKEGWVDLGDWLYAEMVYPPTDSLFTTSQKVRTWPWARTDTGLLHRVVRLFIHYLLLLQTAPIPIVSECAQSIWVFTYIAN